ncbi:MAG: PKD domain-containing protein [bacterium]
MKRFAAPLLAAAVMAACSDNPTTSVATPPLEIPQATQSLAPVNAPLSAPIPGHYIVVFKNSVLNPTAMASSISMQHQGAIEHTYTTAIKGVALALTAAEASAMRADPNVAFVEQDQTAQLQSLQASAPWGLDRIDQHALPLSTTYVANANGTGVTAYVIDTGINYSNVDFGGRAVLGIDEVTPGGPADDCFGHGTGVASVLGGTTYGVAKNIRIVSIRVADCAGNISTSRVLAGIDWISKHLSLPAVANLSMTLTLSSALTQAMTTSIATGVVYVVAAGNNANDACSASPANVPNALTVAASNSVDQFASWSSFGPCVDINAPGEGISMAWVGSTTATHSGTGTSWASPHVAGVAALYLQAHPTATAAQVRSALVSNATTNALRSVPANTPNLLVYSGFISAGNQPPVASFTTNCSALSCSMDASTSTTTGSATYAWTFGDGATASGKTTSHSYASPGTYAVTLTVTDANGTNSKTSSMTVSATNQAPVARFTASCPTLTCTFNASTSTDNIGIVSYNWTWGDGRSETHSSPISNNSYVRTGTYVVTLKVTDGGGLTNSMTTSVLVPSASSNTAPAATMSAPSNNATFVQGASVAFAGNATDVQDGVLSGSSLTWASSLDGQIGTGTSFSTSNLSVGTHVITLTAHDAQGATGTVTRSITVTPQSSNQAPVARFTWTCSAAGSLHCAVNGSSSTDDVGVVSYTWAWGNGKSETHAGSSSGNTWTTGGTYNVTLTVTDGSGLTNSVTHSVVVQ